MSFFFFFFHLPHKFIRFIQLHGWFFIWVVVLLFMHFDRVKCYTKSYHRHRMNPTCASNKLQSIIKLGVVTSIWRNLHMNWPKLDWNLHVVILCQPNIFNEHCMWCQRAYVTVAGLQTYKVRISVHIDYISQFITLWKYHTYHMCVILRLAFLWLNIKTKEN